MRFAVAAAVLATSVMAQDAMSTDYLTELVTITACPETVTNCPARQKTTSVATSVIAVTTETVLSTRVHTITACPPEVTNCPARSTITSTEIYSATNVAPVTSASAAPTYVWANSSAAAPTYAPPPVYPTGVPVIPPPVAPVCPGSSVIAVTKSYTTVLTSVEYQTVAVPCPTTVGVNPTGTGAPVPTGAPGNGTVPPHPVPTGGAASFTGSAIFAVAAGVVALIFA